MTWRLLFTTLHALLQTVHLLVSSWKNKHDQYSRISGDKRRKCAGYLWLVESYVEALASSLREIMTCHILPRDRRRWIARIPITFFGCSCPPLGISGSADSNVYRYFERPSAFSPIWSKMTRAYDFVTLTNGVVTGWPRVSRRRAGIRGPQGVSQSH